MRSQDKAIFLEAARQFQIWILVRRTNRGHWNMWAGPDTRRNELIARRRQPTSILLLTGSRD
jgi:hypothetical protein